MTSTNDGSSLEGTSEPLPGRRKLPAWTPFALIAGSTVALGLPLVFLYKRQRSILQKSLQGSAAPPPRRSVASKVSRFTAATPTTRPVVAHGQQSTQHSTREDDSDYTMPGVGDLYGAITSAPKTSAMLGLKAFGIATCVVGISAVFVVIGIQQITGVKSAREFGLLMRHAVWTTFPGLTSIIHRRSKTAEEMAGASEGSLASEMAEGWSFEEAEKRLDAAYEQGGITAWQLVAMKELEIEAIVERERRKKRIDKLRPPS